MTVTCLFCTGTNVAQRASTVYYCNDCLKFFRITSLVGEKEEAAQTAVEPLSSDTAALPEGDDPASE